MELPRLTGALRSFSNVTRQDEYIEDSSEMMVGFYNYIFNLI